MPLDYESLVHRRHIRASRSRSPSVNRRDDYRRRISYIEEDLVKAVHNSFQEANEISRTLSNTDLRSSSAHPQDYPAPPPLPPAPLPTRSSSLSYPSGRAAAIRESAKTAAHPSEPLRKYDVYGLRSWSYPIWKYLNTTYYGGSNVPNYLHVHSYQPPLMTSDANRAYSGYAPLAAEHSYNLASPATGDAAPWYAVHGYGSGYRRYHTRPPADPWHRDYSCLGLRHFGSYRPRYVQHTARPVWASYY